MICRRAFRDRRTRRGARACTHTRVLVVDEVGYLTYGTDAANMLFHVVNDRHRRQRAMIFTTNKALDAGAESFTTTTWRSPSSIASSSAADSHARRSSYAHYASRP